jgi:hypothetical protein
MIDDAIPNKSLYTNNKLGLLQPTKGGEQGMRRFMRVNISKMTVP